MAEINKNDGVKAIAFYLPQFHTIPENDKAHGKGFTEWTNTKKAVPLFEGHYQPRTPLNGNYYNLLDKDVMKNQSELAQKYGIFGFCYYHYWFKNGKKLLEKPIENMLKDKSITIPFCLSWANENWSKRWDGGNNEVIVAQDYGDKAEWEEHFLYLLEFFKDERYITIDNKPLFIIYKPEQIPELEKMLNYFEKRIKECGFEGICISVQYPFYYCDSRKDIFDYYIEFEPVFTKTYNNYINKNPFVNAFKKQMYNLNMSAVVNCIQNTKRKLSTTVNQPELQIRDYDSDWSDIISRNIDNNKMILGGFVDWDNTPRNKNGLAYKGASPEKFENYLSKLKDKVINENKLPVIFINAWNEWAEGAFLEPDEKNQYKYLEAVQKALK